ncbi:MAG: Archaeal 2-phospho-L-lactate transferase/Bacterial gluconeogenesis factor [Candidatus Alkanophagales archaeon MCA70_species_1]|nr:Archaeal 2-phospho-L-lactate transferase/Bacterial gluconeogenesis factor [Candidatus Alkanophaga volatiphilum]
MSRKTPTLLVFSGGTGTPKLLIGLKNVFDEAALSVIVNTAEDVWVSGNLVCPDIDSVLYALSGRIDEERWWGVKGDTFTTHEALKKLGYVEVLKIGDSDRATHILRSELLRAGKSLTEATRILAERLGVRAKVIPMTDDRVETFIHTTKGAMHFQEFWVLWKGEPEVLSVEFRGVDAATPSAAFQEELRRASTVLIGPSNPITSIGPILRLRGVREALKNKFVVAVSPIIGRKAVSGPAAKLMRACGYEASAFGVLKCYADFLDALIVDTRDDVVGSAREINGVKILATDTIMRDVKSCERLARFILNIIEAKD